MRVRGVRGGYRHCLPLSQDAARGGYDPLVSREAFGDDGARFDDAAHTDAVFHDVVSFVDDENVSAFAVRHDGRLRKHCPLGLIDYYGAASKRAGPQQRIRFQCNPDLAQAGVGIDHRAEEAYASLEGSGEAGDVHRGGLSDFEDGQILFGDLSAHFDLTAVGVSFLCGASGSCVLSLFGFADGQILFGDLSAHFDLTAAGETKQRGASGTRDLTHFGIADEYGAIDRCYYSRPIQARLV